MALSVISRRSPLLLAVCAGSLSLFACTSEHSPGTLALAVTPSGLNVTPGGSGNATVSVTRGGAFTDAVALSQTGAPAGMTVTFSPASVPAGSSPSTANVAVAPSVATGNYSVTVSAAGTDVTTATTTLTIAVVNGESASVEFCAAPPPIWVAQQDGSGPWTLVVPNAGTSTYEFTFTSGQGGIAVVHTENGFNELNVFYAIGAEFSGLGTVNLSSCGSRTVRGTVAPNLAATELAFVTLGSSSATTGPALSGFPAYVLNDVLQGSLDLVAAVSDATFHTRKIILRRAVDIATGNTLAVLDFEAAEAFMPATANVTVTGLGTDEATVYVTYTGLSDSSFAVVSSNSSYTSSSGAAPYLAIPAANLNTGELQQLQAVALDASDYTPTADRESAVYFHDVADKTIALGPALSTPTVTEVVTAHNARPRVQLQGQTEYNRLLRANFAQNDVQRLASILVTAGYFGGEPATWDVTLPDLSATTGWNSAFGLQDGVAIDWGVNAQGGASRFLDGNPADGSAFQSATSSSAVPLMVRGARTGTDGRERPPARGPRRVE